MSTSLYMITNAPHNPKKAGDYSHILKDLKKLNIEKSSYWNSTGDKTIKEHLDWSCQIFEPDNFNKYHRVEFEGDFMNSPTAVGYNWHLYTGYTYDIIYKNFEIDWFMDFRTEIFEMIQLLGGSEIIYVADNGGHALCKYLSMSEEGVSYDKIRKKMQNDLGDPITDYTKLDYETLDYQNITEYFLDNFRDMKSVKNK